MEGVQKGARGTSLFAQSRLREGRQGTCPHTDPSWWPASETGSWFQTSSAAEERSLTGSQSDSVACKHPRSTYSRRPGRDGGHRLQCLSHGQQHQEGLSSARGQLRQCHLIRVSARAQVPDPRLHSQLGHLLTQLLSPLLCWAVAPLPLVTVTTSCSPLPASSTRSRDSRRSPTGYAHCARSSGPSERCRQRLLPYTANTSLISFSITRSAASMP